MTLKRCILLFVSAFTFSASLAQAYELSDRGPAPIPFPGEDDFGRGEHSRLVRKTIYINRHVIDQTFPLRQLAGIDESYRGYIVESVEVEVLRSGPRADISLLADGRAVESVFSPQIPVVLRPRYHAVIGETIRSLQLEVRGRAQLGAITVNLRRQGIDRPDRPGRLIEVPLNVYRRFFGNDQLDLARYIDFYRYRGYRIQSIEIDGTAIYNVALMDLFINGYRQGPTMQLDRLIRRFSVFPQNAILGQSASNLVLQTRGDMEIRQVTLRLSDR